MVFSSLEGRTWCSKTVNMADGVSDRDGKKEKSVPVTRSSEPTKEKDSSGKQSVRKQSKNVAEASTSKTQSKPVDKNDEILSILKSLRSEQVLTNQKMTEMENRIVQMESYDYDEAPYEYDQEYCAEVASVDESLLPQKRKSDDNNNDKNETAPVQEASRFANLAKRFKSSEICSKDIDAVLAANVNELFRQGMEEEQYSTIVKDEVTPRPGNCDSLVTVKLNQLVWDIVSPVARSKDKKLQNVETSLVKAACIVTKTVDSAAEMEKEAKENGYDIGPIIDSCNDALALLGHANRQLNMARRDFLKPELKNDTYSHIFSHSIPFTDQLFGDDVSKTAREIEEFSKIGHKLQYNPVRGSLRRPGFRSRYRGSGRGVRGRGSYGSYGTSDYGGRGGYGGTSEYQQMPKNPQRRGGGKRM